MIRLSLNVSKLYPEVELLVLRRKAIGGGRLGALKLKEWTGVFPGLQPNTGFLLSLPLCSRLGSGGGGGGKSEGGGSEGRVKGRGVPAHSEARCLSLSLSLSLSLPAGCLGRGALGSGCPPYAGGLLAAAIAGRVVLRAGRCPQCPRVRPAAPARATLPLSRLHSWPQPLLHALLFLLGLLLRASVPPVPILLLLLEDTRAQQGDGCGHTVRGPESGTLASINYPQTYPSSIVCKWEIRVKMGERIRVKLGDVDIEDSDSCHFNYLRIYNEIGLGRTEIGVKHLTFAI
nr:uncharacterized protein LOC101789108 [Cavia porcellus]